MLQKDWPPPPQESEKRVFLCNNVFIILSNAWSYLHICRSPLLHIKPSNLGQIDYKRIYLFMLYDTKKMKKAN